MWVSRLKVVTIMHAVLMSVRMCRLSNKSVSYSVCDHWRPIICFGATIKDNRWMYISWLEPVWPLSTEPSLCPQVYNMSSLWLCVRETQWFEWLVASQFWRDSLCKAVVQNSVPCKMCQIRHGVQTTFLFLTVCLTSATQRMSNGHK